MAKKRYKKVVPKTTATAAVGASAPAAQKTPVTGSFEMTEDEVINPQVPPAPTDIPTTHLDDVKKEHPGLSDSYARLIVDAQNYRDKKKEELAAKKDNYLRTYLSSWTKAESDEDKAARERKEKKARRWAAVGDAVAALANIGGAMGGATPMQLNKTLSQAQLERMERARKLRQAEQAKLDEQNKRVLDKASKEYDAALKGLDSAEKNVQNQKYRAMMLQNTAQNQEAAQRLAEEKAEWQKEYQGILVGIAQQNANTNAARAAETANYHGQMVGIAQQKANNSGHGSKKANNSGHGSKKAPSEKEMHRNRGAQMQADDPSAYENWKKGQPRSMQRRMNANQDVGYEQYSRSHPSGVKKQGNWSNGGKKIKFK